MHNSLHLFAQIYLRNAQLSNVGELLTWRQIFAFLILIFIYDI